LNAAPQGEEARRACRWSGQDPRARRRAGQALRGRGLSRRKGELFDLVPPQTIPWAAPRLSGRSFWRPSASGARPGRPGLVLGRVWKPRGRSRPSLGRVLKQPGRSRRGRGRVGKGGRGVPAGLGRNLPAWQSTTGECQHNRKETLIKLKISTGGLTKPQGPERDSSTSAEKKFTRNLRFP
jgi:hypothetical protein